MHQNDTRIDMVCDHCGEELPPSSKRRPHSARYYCSAECHRSASRTGITRDCKVCGTPFYRSASQASEYCSRKCFSKGARRPIEERLWEKVDKSGGPHACWPWTSKLGAGGYARISAGGRGTSLAAHRVAYELMVGPIPEGLVIDHVCRNRACVNPAHLEPVTIAENNRRGYAPHMMLHHNNHCKRGHKFTPESTRETVRNGRRERQCLICYNDRRRERRRKAREKK